MISRSRKPIKPCEGCRLNLGERCAAFLYPTEKWTHHDCDGYNDEALIEKYLPHNDGQGAHARKAIRQADGKMNSQVDEEANVRIKVKKFRMPD